MSIVHGPLYVVLLVAALSGLAGLLLVGRGRRWWTLRVPLAVAAAVILLAGFRLLLAVAQPWPDPLPVSVWVWSGIGLLGVTLGVAGVRRRQLWRIRGAAVLASVIVVVGAADRIDAVYGAYPTLAAALQLPPPDSVAAGTVVDTHRPVVAAVPGRPLALTWQAPRDLPAHGAVFRAAVPPVRSGFVARSTWMYLPPAYLTARRPQLPLLMLIAGQPGSSRDWLDGGQLADRMDRWAAAHAGLAPIVVMPDALGSELANPLCMDSRLGAADTYLSQDVIGWVGAHLQIDPDRAHWAVGGLSFGGTCALQLALAHPGLFRTVFDVGGQCEPTLGGHTRTVAATFGGDEAAFDKKDPLHELAVRRYPSLAALFVVGAQDHVYGPQQRVVAAAARAAGLTVVAQQRRGGHSWSIAGPALSDSLPRLTARMDLTG